MKTRLKVWLQLPDGTRLQAGELIAAFRDNGAIDGQFRYLQSYLDDPRAFALDPVNLPLAPGAQDAHRPQAGVHGVFEDALPDDWGRRLLCRRYQLSDHQARPPHLLSLMEGGGMGALWFGKVRCPEPRTDNQSTVDLQKLARLALDFEKGTTAMEDDPLLPYLFGLGSSPGGARPKFLSVTENGQPCLVKLPSLKDSVPLVPIEAACMATAMDCGFPVAPVRLIKEGMPLLLVERFDVTPQGGRRHMLSMKTLLNAEYHYSKSYLDMAQLLERHSAEPGADKMALFQQMLFNACIGNTDDHLKNFALLHDDRGWRLSPAYDLVPSFPLLPHAQHVLRFHLDNRRPDWATIRQLGRAFGFSSTRTNRLIEEVLAGLSGLEKHLQQAEAPEDVSQLLLEHVAAYLSGLSH